MATCAVCTSLTKKQLKKVAAAYEEGSTPESISTTYSVSYDDAVHHCTVCLKGEDADEDGRADHLKEFFKSVKKLANLAQTQYESQPDRSDLVHAFTSLIGEARSILDEMDKSSDPSEIVKTVIKHALNPFIRKGLESLTKELLQAKPELIAAGAKPVVVDAVIKQILSGYGQSMKGSRLDIVERLARAVGVPKKDLSKVLSFAEGSSSSSKTIQ